MNTNPQVTIIVPAWNEAATIGVVCKRLKQLPEEVFEFVLVDDGSVDETHACMVASAPTNSRVIQRLCNGGKTAAVRDGLAVASGKWVIVQDADLEYNPAVIPKLLGVACERGGAVYGRRPSHWNRPHRWAFAGGVLLVDFCLWLVYRRWVRDHATCYKLVPRELLKTMELQSTGFEGCVEITAKLMRLGIAIHQVPIDYTPRSTRDGKKLSWRYGPVALKAVWRWRNWDKLSECA